MKKGDKVWYFDFDDFQVKEGIIKTDNYPYSIELEDKTRPDRQWVFDDLSDLQQALRHFRNNNQIITNKIQNAIDSAELKKYNCEGLINKYFALPFGNSYIYVKSVERLYRGPRLKGAIITLYENTSDFEVFTNYEINLNWEDLNSLKEISEQEFTTLYTKQSKNFLSNYAK